MVVVLMKVSVLIEVLVLMLASVSIIELEWFIFWEMISDFKFQLDHVIALSSFHS